MNLKEKYQDNYILLAGLRAYIESGTMLASVNFWRDSAQKFKELAIIENRVELLKLNSQYEKNTFLTVFVKEEFPSIEHEIGDDIIGVIIPIIEELEGKETAILVKQFLIDYALSIAKASKEDWLAFIALKDNISDEEEKFIQSLRLLLDF